MSGRSRQIFSPLVWTGAALGAGAALLGASSTAREVTTDALKSIFVVVTTPFIFEATCALFFIIGLLVFNHWRRMRDGDEWVYLVDQETEDKTLPKALNERLHNIILTEKPETTDDASARRGIIEGYLELGMGAQALTEFTAAAIVIDDCSTRCLHARVLAANMDTEKACVLLREASSVYPADRATVSAAALDISRWMRQHMPQSDLATLWQKEAITLARA